MGVRPPLQFTPFGRVRQEAIHRAGDRGAVAEGDQDAAMVGQDFLGVRDRRGDNGSAGAHRVGDRTADDLMWVEIGHEADIRCLQVLNHLLQRHISIYEFDPGSETQGADESMQLFPVTLARGRAHPRMRFAGDEVHHVRMLARDAGEGMQRVFNSFIGADEPERRKDRASRIAELGLGALARGWGRVNHWRAMRYHLDLPARDAIVAGQNRDCRLCQDDDPRAALRQIACHLTQSRIGARQRRVQRRHDRLRRVAVKVQQVFTPLAAEQAIFVLHIDDPNWKLSERLRGGAVARAVIAGNLYPHAPVVRIAVPPVVHRRDHGAHAGQVFNRHREIARKSRNAALAWWKAGEVGHAEMPVLDRSHTHPHARLDAGIWGVDCDESRSNSRRERLQ